MADRFKQSFRMALKSIAGNKMRAFLTMLGIIIGVMALVILVSLVNGATSSVTQTISSLGSNLLTVDVLDDKGQPITMEELSQWTQEPALGRIAPYAQSSATGKSGLEKDSVSLYGVTAAYQQVQGLQLLIGRYIKNTDVDNHSPVCVINETCAKEIIGYTDCLGAEISLNGLKHTVVGVLKDDDKSLTAIFSSGTCVAHVPFSSLIRVGSSVSGRIESFYVGPAEDGTVAQAEERMKQILMERLHEDEDAFTLTRQDGLEDAMSSITSVLTILLGGIAAISLVVGGIGIMNIMLVTVTERTREIGIRKAIGASRSAILQQFLLESIVLCMMGCAIGIFLSWTVLKLIGLVVAGLSIQFVMDGSVVLLAVLFCFAIGVGFGLYPANKAASMKPIDALHYGG